MSWAQRSVAFLEKNHESWAAIGKISFQARLAPCGPTAGHRRNQQQHHCCEHIFGLLRLLHAAPVKGATEDLSWVEKMYLRGSPAVLLRLLAGGQSCYGQNPGAWFWNQCRAGQDVMGRVTHTTPHASLGICTVEGSAPSRSLCSTI